VFISRSFKFLEVKLTETQFNQVAKVRSILARAANSDAPGERQVAANMAQHVMTKYSLKGYDLTRGLSEDSDIEYVLNNFAVAKQLWGKETSEQLDPLEKPDKIFHIRVQAYTRKDGVKVREHLRVVRPVWVSEYTRKDGKKVKGHWRNGDLRNRG
jgi:hypothetical protein